jgi:tRNA(fMet)-specific endonuclease VapC
MWILDTDHVSLFLEGNENVRLKIRQISPNYAITIVTVQEIFNGWIVKINNTKKPDDLVKLYHKLYLTVEYFKKVKILDFNESACNCYNQLLIKYKYLQKDRLKKDIPIAAIALSVGGIMVTRNYKDFSLIPELTLENWC